MSIEPRLTDGEVVQVIEGLEVGRLTGGVERAIADAATAKALAWVEGLVRYGYQEPKVADALLEVAALYDLRWPPQQQGG